jgi:hypothetical protein
MHAPGSFCWRLGRIVTVTLMTHNLGHAFFVLCVSEKQTGSVHFLCALVHFMLLLLGSRPSWSNAMQVGARLAFGRLAVVHGLRHGECVHSCVHCCAGVAGPDLAGLQCASECQAGRRGWAAVADCQNVLFVCSCSFNSYSNFPQQPGRILSSFWCH